jgi:hypothetical protein
MKIGDVCIEKKLVCDNKWIIRIADIYFDNNVEYVDCVLFMETNPYGGVLPYEFTITTTELANDFELLSDDMKIEIL